MVQKANSRPITKIPKPMERALKEWYSRNGNHLDVLHYHKEVLKVTLDEYITHHIVVLSVDYMACVDMLVLQPDRMKPRVNNRELEMSVVDWRSHRLKKDHFGIYGRPTA